MNRNIPFYLQIIRILRAEIIAGKLPPGYQFPDENQLAEHFGVSKDVIRKSMRILAGENLVRRVRHSGTFVTDMGSRRARNILFLSCHGIIPLECFRRGIERGADHSIYNIMIKMIDPNDLERERACLKQIDPRDFSAIVASPAIGIDDCDNAEYYYRNYIKNGIPLIVVDHDFTASLPADVICFDEYNSVKRVAEEVVSQIEPDSRTAFFFLGIPHRIIRARSQALADVAAGMNSDPERVRCFVAHTQSLDINFRVAELLEQYLQADFHADTLIVSNNILAYGFYQELKKMGRAHEIKRIVTIGDPCVCDDDFNRILTCHYRLFDAFTEPLMEILTQRLYQPENIEGRIVKKIMFQPMTAQEARNYLASAYLRGISFQPA